MAIKIEIDGTELTDVTHATITMQIDAGIQTRIANSLAIDIDRRVGDEKGHESDLLTFKTLRGGNDRAPVKPVSLKIELIDEQEESETTIGTWDIKESIVGQYALIDDGPSLTENVVLRGNKFSFSHKDGGATEEYDVTREKLAGY
jgi:hypothetical protein